MSTTVISPRTRKISVGQVQRALEAVAREHPDRVDRRVTDGLPARYIDRGAPNCLVALVLTRLGYSTGVLKALDHEPPVGGICQSQGGVAVAESRHPALRRIDPAARALLDWVQRHQDCGQRWGAIVRDAFKTRPRWHAERRDRERRPWLYA